MLLLKGYLLITPTTQIISEMEWKKGRPYQPDNFTEIIDGQECDCSSRSTYDKYQPADYIAAQTIAGGVMILPTLAIGLSQAINDDNTRDQVEWRPNKH